MGLYRSPVCLPYMFLYQTMTKGFYMPNINAFKPMVHKEIFNGFYLYKPIHE